MSEMLLYALNLGFFILGFAIYPVAYGVGFTLQGLPIVIFWKGFSMSITPEFVQRNFQLPQECPKVLSWGPYYF